jgi:hypothetical protein
MIQALPTIYDGVRYRSRIEARWAIFMDTLSIEHEYEREGFDCGNGVYYLPDFWLPALKVWIEVKGELPTPGEERKAVLLANGTGHPVYTAVGGFHHAPPMGLYLPGFDDGVVDVPCYFWQCTVCGTLKIRPVYIGERLRGRECQVCNVECVRFVISSPKLIGAYDQARCHKFI